MTDNYTIVHVSGSCKKNGHPDARAGYGIFYKANDPRNSHGVVQGKQTNQRAELSAVYHAMKMQIETNMQLPLCIVSDSEYALKSISEWAQKRDSNDFKISRRKPLANQDLISQITELIPAFGNISLHQGAVPTSSLLKQGICLQLVKNDHTNPDQRAAKLLAEMACS